MPSLGSKSECWGNPVAERLFATIEREFIDALGLASASWSAPCRLRAHREFGQHPPAALDARLPQSQPRRSCPPQRRPSGGMINRSKLSDEPEQAQPPPRRASTLDQVFALNRAELNIPRGLEVVGILLASLVVLSLLGEQRYWLSLALGVLIVGLSDPGGEYGVRVGEMAWVGGIGTVLTAVGFGIGGGPWGWVVLVAFAVTLLSGLALKFGLHRFTGALLLNVWFLVAISIPAGEHLSPAHSNWSGQALAWLVGSAIWITLTLAVWLIRGRHAQETHVPEIPADMTTIKLSRQVILFGVIRAVAVTAAVAIAFGLHVPDADWMPIAALVAMKGSLDQTTLVAEQRLVGALIGAAVAAAFLLTLGSKHALEVVIVVLAAIAASIRGVNYALYCAAIAGAVLIGIDLPHPTNFTAEFHRVLFTLAGVAIAWLVMVLAGVIQKRSAKVAR